MVDIITDQHAVCTHEGCGAEIRRDHIRVIDLRPRTNFPLFTRQRVEAICPNCHRIYRFTRRMCGSLWEIEGGVDLVTDPRQQEIIRRHINAAEGAS